jgi:ketosteroid isomerase-like protein
MVTIARSIRLALESGDLENFAGLLDPDVHWGPPHAEQPPCRNRRQVVDWYAASQARGVSATVNDVTVLADRLLVEMVVAGTEEADERGGHALRWQVLTVRDGRVVDIVGFDNRDDASAYTAQPLRAWPGTA